MGMASSPWKRIHVDFAGPFLGSYFMVVVDAHSKWLEVYPMKSICLNSIRQRTTICIN